MKLNLKLIPHYIFIFFRWGAYSLIVILIGIAYPLILMLFRKEISWNFSSRNARFALSVLGIQVKTKGLSIFSNLGGCIVIANHRSWFDSLALAAIIPIRTHFVAKKQYFKSPLIGLWLRLYQHIPIDYTSTTPLRTSDSKFLFNVLKSGRVIVFYPEGTRSTGDYLLPFKRGPWWLGAATSAPIIETHITGAEQIWPKGASIFSLKSGTIEIQFNPAQEVTRETENEKFILSQEKFKTWHQKY